ncbi:hypothetical protein NCAS_0B03300 [Naumovozyma castellii]|uniref:Hsp90 chaperone protein kinase-targeting subunit n=1 Tax=Naumovozyma castellii TaxID=27288 RepID=G0VBT8_NAUCA|nr:hypothetical protein NCAS_0B03300 [Naumovozyma castellii CBS 4309]CCC68414.1 hypothetical protein NCAS_0B03300 [Naumovozyma castellii CBS 4309]
MVVDYSKWDKIEISDDSDVEVHPNVDKKSFIRWKQQSIHEKRMQRNQDIKNLEAQLEMYKHLNKRVDKLLNEFQDEDFASKEKISKFLNGSFDKREKSEGENVDPDIATYNEMVEDLFDQLGRDAKKEGNDPNNGKIIKGLLLKHRAKIDSVSKEATEKLKELYIEKNAHISSEDIHTGFDSSFMNTKTVEEDTKAAEAAAKAIDSVKINEAKNSLSEIAVTPSKQLDLPAAPLQFIEYKDDVMKLAPETEEFGNISVNDYKKSEQFLLSHMPIISEQQKDALLMKSFEYQLEKDELHTYQVIHQSELLAYIREIYDLKKIPFLDVEEMKNIITMFFQKVMFNAGNQRGMESFLDSVKTKFNHIKERSKVLAEESVNKGQFSSDDVEGVPIVQLKSLDDSTELEVHFPDMNSTDPEELKKIEAFNKIPKKMQDAVKTGDINEVNEVFKDIPEDEAEQILEWFNEADVIGVRAVLDDEEDFKKLQEEYNKTKHSDKDHHDVHEVSDDVEELDTADIVD